MAVRKSPGRVGVRRLPVSLSDRKGLPERVRPRAPCVPPGLRDGPGTAGVPYTPWLTSSLPPLAFAPRMACSVPTTLRVSSGGPSWGLDSWGAHLPPAPDVPGLVLTACVCVYDGRHFRPGDVIYHTTDGTGGCISARCSANGTIERGVSPCSATSPAPPTTFSFSTSAPGKADARGHRAGLSLSREGRSLPSLTLGRASPARLPGRTAVLRGTIRTRAPGRGQRPASGRRCAECQAPRLLSLLWGILEPHQSFPPEGWFCSGPGERASPT